MYVMVDFICMGILELQGAEARITKWKILPTAGLELTTLWLWSDHRNR